MVETCGLIRPRLDVGFSYWTDTIQSSVCAFVEGHREWQKVPPVVLCSSLGALVLKLSLGFFSCCLLDFQLFAKPLYTQNTQQ